ncbi:neural cell adhesion molecule 1 [Anastrepha ludens]|uniref:neural cell adhesion molecule 1 n=1 Tax=Anastrepha ludens TaxID=28586 RepID=UPI0023B07180|nr:neural cell adhesion molecule 1 [Anastrepha ludens]
MDFRPGRGIYDLQIKNTSYNRDNGRFECRIKAKGTGADVHQEFYNLTVLTPPHPPMITPGNIAIATEDKPLELTCSSVGGSPDPMITWYREGSTVPLQSYILKGGSKNHYTNATLQILPRRADDGAKYKCVVWNRAMTEGHTLETTVTLNVNFYPRVEVGPQNPLRVERDHIAKLECNVDAKPKVSNVRWSRNGQYVSATPTHTIFRVGRHHAGKYTCTADNGLGKSGEKDIVLDVLFPPMVVIESKTHEAEEGETVLVRCNVTSNPPPITIEWLKEGAPDFRFTGELLTLVSVRAEHAGNYICRAVNLMNPFNSKRIEGVGNSTVALLVRHRPGQAYITPNKPIVHVGNGVTLSCSANPPGWPVPQYRWFRDVDGEFSNTQKILAQGPQYSIPKAHLGSEGKYHCHAVNELGIGKMATIILEVHQPPQFLAKLQQHMTRRVGDVDYAVTCSAKGKPTPIIRWIKDGTEVLPGRKLYDIRTTPSQGQGGVVTVQSILKFRGKARPNGNQLVPADRGLYTCLYENEVNSANSSMHLRIEHEPIVLHQYNKVAYDVHESAEVICKVQAYPKPEFQWQFGNNPSPLTMSSDGHYEIATRTDNNDVYTSILRINHILHSDYGDYTCRAVNPLDTIRTQIRLQPKGAPEKPTALKAMEISHNYAILSWIPGFNGGMLSTKFLVTYRRVATPREQTLSDCATHTYTSALVSSLSSAGSSGGGISSADWLEFDCYRENPCKVMPLDQYQSYMFKVYALNSKGSSGYSNEALATTKVSKIPPPLHVTYDPSSHVLGINVAATCLSLIAIVESLVNRETPLATWEIVDTVTLLPSGTEATFKEAVINHIPQTTHYSASGRTLGHAEDITLALAETAQGPTVRVKLCLRTNHDHCGQYANAEIGKSYMPETSTLTTSAVIAIIVSSIAFLGLVAFLLLFCHCRRVASNKKSTTSPAKEYDLDSGRPSIVAQTNQAPPPYYPTGSLDSKSLDSHAMELTLTAVQDTEEQLHQQQQQKSAAAVYGSQNGYGYHVTSALGGVGSVSGVGNDEDSYQVTPLAHSAIASRSECKYHSISFSKCNPLTVSTLTDHPKFTHLAPSSSGINNIYTSNSNNNNNSVTNSVIGSSGDHIAKRAAATKLATTANAGEKAKPATKMQTRRTAGPSSMSTTLMSLTAATNVRETTKPPTVSGSSGLHYPSTENNYATKSNSICSSLASAQDTLWRVKMAAAQQHSSVAAAAAAAAAAAQIYIEQPTGSVTYGTCLDPLTQCVVDYVGYPVPPPPHITQISASASTMATSTAGNCGSPHDFSNTSQGSCAPANSGLSVVSQAAIGESSQRQEYADELQQLQEQHQHQQQQQQQQQQQLQSPPQPPQRFGTLKKSRQQQQRMEQQLADIIQDLAN